MNSHYVNMNYEALQDPSLRFFQRNTIYLPSIIELIGFIGSMSLDKWFIQFGNIISKKIVPACNGSYNHKLYVEFDSVFSACNAFIYLKENSNAKVFFGTNRLCKYWAFSKGCEKKECSFLHVIPEQADIVAADNLSGEEISRLHYNYAKTTVLTIDSETDTIFRPFKWLDSKNEGTSTSNSSNNTLFYYVIGDRNLIMIDNFNESSNSKNLRLNLETRSSTSKRIAGRNRMVLDWKILG